jgi:hypothetical protein
MNAEALLSRLSSLGARVAIEAGELTIRAPRGVLTEADRRAIVEHKPGLIALVVPTLPTWEALSALRWGPAIGDPEPGLVIDRPDRDRMRAALVAPDPDPYALAERAAIMDEAREESTR